MNRDNGTDDIRNRNQEDKETGTTSGSVGQDARTKKTSRIHARRKQRDRNRPSPANELSPSIRPKNPIGDLFYSLGFFAEAWIIHIGRILRDSFVFLGQLAVWLFGDVVSKVFGFIWGLLKDFFGPVVGFFTGILRLFQVSASDQKKNREKTKGMSFSQYLTYGFKKYWQLIKNMLRLLLPLGAVGILLVTMFTTLNQKYALEVLVNGEHVGFVANELVVQEAKRILDSRMRLVAGQTTDAWNLEHRVSITAATDFSDQTQLADEIIRHSPDEVFKGRGVYVGGELFAAITDWQEMESYLNQLLESARDEEIGGEPSFVKNITLSKTSELFLKESEESVEALVARMESQDEGAVVYNVQDGESLKDIEGIYNITHEIMLKRNPDLGQSRNTFKPETGTELLIMYPEPFLQVQLSVREEEEVAIDFEIQRKENHAKPKNFSSIVTKGVQGLKKIFYDSVYINKELVAKIEIEGSSQILQEPVTQVVEIGTSGIGMDVVSPSAAWEFPLPAATSSARGLGGSHEGIDVSGPTGSAIVAAEAGVVVTAGYHVSLGYHVKISHPVNAQGQTVTTVYGHASELLVSEGDTVYKGQAIAIMGNTGRSFGAHLHFELRLDGVAIDPYFYIPKRF